MTATQHPKPWAKNDTASVHFIDAADEFEECACNGSGVVRSRKQPEIMVHFLGRSKGYGWSDLRIPGSRIRTGYSERIDALNAALAGLEKRRA